MNVANLLRDAFKPSGGPDRYDLIQALRFVAAFAVVACHASFYAQERLDPTTFRYSAGAHGVDLFFVISGFVMILASRHLLGTADGWKHFAARRIVRIVPMYWLATSVKLAALFFAAHLVLHAEINWLYILKSYFFIPDVNVDNHIKPLLGVGWTLLFEMLYYAVFTLCLLLKLNPTRFCAGLFGALAVASFVKTPEWPVAVYFYSDPIVLNFVWGMVIAHLVLQRIYLPKAIAMICIAAPLAYIFLSMNTTEFAARIPVGIGAALIVYGCASLEKQTSITVPNVFIFLGATSYSLYLFHPIFAPAAPEILKRIGLISPLLSVIMSTTIALVAGCVIYALVENPVTNYLNRSVKRWLGGSKVRSVADAECAP